MRRRIFICFLIATFVTIILVLHAEEPKGSEMTNKSNLEKIEEYKKLLEEFEKSNYMIVKGKVERKSKEVKSPALEEKEVKLITKTLNAIKGKVSVPEGAKVIVHSEKNRYVVIFWKELPKGVRGTGSFKVIIDSKSGEVLEILEGPN